MSNVEQFEKAVTDAGAVAMRVMRQPNGSERLVIQTPGGLITREVPLRGDLAKTFRLRQPRLRNSSRAPDTSHHHRPEI
jgi:hypothetical protein